MLHKEIERATGKDETVQRLDLNLHRGEAFNWMTQVHAYTSIGFQSDSSWRVAKYINRDFHFLTSACGGICRLGRSAKRLKLN